MKFKAGQEYRTRGGHKARIYAVECGGSYPIHGSIEISEGVFTSVAWLETGAFADMPGYACASFDLVPNKRTVYVNLYRQPDGTQFWAEYETPKSAVRGAAHGSIHNGRVVIVAEGLPIEIED